MSLSIACLCVQLWASLEAVFSSGDIAKQMPSESKKFSRADKEWAKLMLTAQASKLVLGATNNEHMK